MNRSLIPCDLNEEFDTEEPETEWYSNEWRIKIFVTTPQDSSVVSMKDAVMKFSCAHKSRGDVCT